ncbi:c-type cytochrome [Aeromonas diversa]|uniref:periplasmic diheme shuttle PdsA n=1 Tax=Aeromonas diversa TaxID=502790 RepID=UPI0039A1FE61
MKKAMAMMLLLGGMQVGVAQAAVEEMAKECDACHGPKGISLSQAIPTIGGLPAVNLGEQMRTYLEGRPAKRVNQVSGDTSKAGDMTQVMKSLSDAQIDALAAYYAALPFVPAKQPFDAAKAAAGKALHQAKCEKCHTGGGRNPDDESSLLGGQMKEYLLYSLHEFREGKRDVDKSMNKALAAMSEADLAALAEYYASLQ